jgi:hypothetical protein
MDFLFWIFVAILLVIGYNCVLKKKLPIEKSMESFYDNFIPPEQQIIHNNTQRELLPASQLNFQHNMQQTIPSKINAQHTSGSPNAQHASGSPNAQYASGSPNAQHASGSPNAQNTSQLGQPNLGSASASNYMGVDDKSALNFASFNVNDNAGSGISGEPNFASTNTRLQSKDLIPQGGDNNMWKKLNPDPEGWLEGRNFLQAGYHLGINTIGQSRKNANYQLRSEPANPRDQVSVWNQSQIDPDVRRCFELD